MTMTRFLRRFRSDIDAYIKSQCPNIGRLDNAERELWIANDEGLYRWAQSYGVDV